MRNFKYIKKYRRHGGVPFADSTVFVGLSKNKKLWTVDKNGKRSQLTILSTPNSIFSEKWCDENWEIFYM